MTLAGRLLLAPRRHELNVGLLLFLPLHHPFLSRGPLIFSLPPFRDTPPPSSTFLVFRLFFPRLYTGFPLPPPFPYLECVYWLRLLFPDRPSVRRRIIINRNCVHTVLSLFLFEFLFPSHVSPIVQPRNLLRLLHVLVRLPPVTFPVPSPLFYSVEFPSFPRSPQPPIPPLPSVPPLPPFSSSSPPTPFRRGSLGANSQLFSSSPSAALHPPPFVYAPNLPTCDIASAVSPHARLAVFPFFIFARRVFGLLL